MSAELAESLQIESADLPSEAVIFGSTAAMRENRAAVEGALHNNVPVLIQGESGTGKELVGRFLHANSILRDGPFVKLNCAAMSSSVLEGELFGYEKGSFPGVNESRNGAIEIADGGTLFLDEASELGSELQTKLFGFLGNGRFSKVGSSDSLQARMRVIYATRDDLDAGTARNAFRQELFSGLGLIRIRLLPLRERRQDIPLLCEYLLEKLSRSFKKPAPSLSGPAFQTLQQWKWPGNMRELENWIARIIIFGAEEALGMEFSRQLDAMGTVEQRHHRVAHLRSGMVKRVRRPRGE